LITDSLLVPANVSVWMVFPENATAPGLENSSAPVPDASIVPEFGPTVNRRSVTAPAPVYRSAPPFRTRFAAALLEAPSALAMPPFFMSATLSTPPMIVVAPVYPLPPAALKAMSMKSISLLITKLSGSRIWSMTYRP
jgi:hypothetical protein